MLCDFDRIDALAAGELASEERASMLAHMENCPACRSYYEAMSALEDTEAAPAGFTARVMDAVRATPQRRTRRPLWRSMATVAACALLVIGLGLGSGLFPAGKSAPETANDSAGELIREIDQTPAGGGDDLEFASDLPLTIHTVTDEALSTSIRAWLADEGISELYADSPREAYDLTMEQVQALNAAIPDVRLPEQMLQLELKSAE